MAVFLNLKNIIQQIAVPKKSRTLANIMGNCSITRDIFFMAVKFESVLFSIIFRQTLHVVNPRLVRGESVLSQNPDQVLPVTLPG